MLKKLFLRFRSEFFKNVLTLMTGTFLAQLIPIFVSPVITRFYTPDDFGVLALFMGVVNIFAVVSSGRYELAIMLPEEEDDAANLFVLSFLLNTFVSFILLIIVLAFNDFLASFFNNDRLKIWFFAVPSVVFVINFFNSLKIFNNRMRFYKNIAVSSVMRALLLSFVQVCLGFLKSGVTGLISGQFFAHLFSSIYLLKKIVVRKNFFYKIKKDRMLRMASFYRKFPSYNVPHTLVNTIFSTLPVFILSSFFTSSIVGLYSFATRIIKMPITLIANSTGNVLFEKVVSMKREKKKYMSYIYNYLILQTIFGVLLFSVIFLLSDYLFYIFGDKWVNIGFYIKILIPWLLMVFIVSPLSFSVNMTFNQKKGLLIEILYGGIKLLSLLVGGYMESVALTLGLFSFGNSIFIFFQCWWFVYLLKKGECNL